MDSLSSGVTPIHRELGPLPTLAAGLLIGRVRDLLDCPGRMAEDFDTRVIPFTGMPRPPPDLLLHPFK